MINSPGEPDDFGGQEIAASEVPLATPGRAQLPTNAWTVVAKNRRVNRDWEELCQRAPANAARCYQHLCSTPLTKYPKRVFPLKGPRYKGAWEYELTGGDRVFYLPDADQRKVIVYYAGPHPNPAPKP